GAEQVSAKQAERENRQFDVQRRLEEDAKLQEQVRERFEGENAQRYTREALEEDEEDGSGARFRDLPDATRDPRMWLMKCKPNQEKMLVIQLMQKFLDSMHTDKPLQIKSAACTDIKGYIYIEAYKELHVREATQGLNNLFYKITQVPVNEMTDVMRVRVDAKKKPLQRNSWVRIRRNDEYKDDLAQVVDLDNDAKRARVRLIPRLRVYVTRGLDDDDTGARTMRPPAKLFIPEEIERFGGECSQSTRNGRKHFNYDGNEFEDGLLLKYYSVRNLRWGDEISPSLAEFERFKAGLGEHAEEELLAAVQSTDLAPKESFAPGDIVKVRENSDLKHIVGVVQSINGSTGAVVIMPTSTDGLFKEKLFKNGLSFQPEQLQKWFKMGDHVKVVGGTRHVGETGLIVRVGRTAVTEGTERRAAAPDQLYIFSDLTQMEIVVPAAHVQECSDVSSGLETLGQYQLHDLVTLDRTGAGVIIKVEHSSFKVLSTTNEELAIDHAQMGRKKSSRGAVTLGADQKKLEANSPVNIIEGAHKGQAGIVKHVFKSFLFVHDVKRKEQSGIMCVRSRQCVLADGSDFKPTVQGYESSGSEMDDGGGGGGRTSFVPQSPSHS
ncbi:transcription elongation factor spt5, partial [Chrysochromulina tobinii]